MNSVIIAIILVCLHCQGSDAANNTVTTTQGNVSGVQANGIIYFAGIPYASPPVGNLRWQPPQAHAKWNTTLGPSIPVPCVQPYSGSFIGSEDCLYLNAYAPDNASAINLPVMIWIHGGGFLTGSQSSLDPLNIVKQGNVVVFAIAYRLGPFANLAQRDLLANGGSANLMLLDQQFAIKWIKDNAAAFGGNASSITIFGESAGGGSTMMQALLPGNQGVVTRVIAESAASLFLVEKKQALEIGDYFTQKAGCTGASSVYNCLMNLTAAQVLFAIPSAPLFILGTGVFWTPVVDDEVLTDQPLALYKDGKYYVDSFLFGDNQDEGSGFVAGQYGANPLSNETYKGQIGLWYPNNVNDIVNTYASSVANSSNLVTLMDILTDFEFLCPMHYIANITFATKTSRNTTFVYLFTITDPNQPGLGSYHALELGYVFGLNSGGAPFTTQQQILSNAMIGYWTNFAATGDPNKGQSSATAVEWPAWTSDDQQLMVLGIPHAAQSDYRVQFCKFWTQLYDAEIYPIVEFLGVNTTTLTTATASTTNAAQTSSSSSALSSSASRTSTSLASSTSSTSSSSISSSSATILSSVMLLVILVFFVFL